MTKSKSRIAILWRGDDEARRRATPDTNRFKAIFAALADAGIDAEPVVYEDDVRNAVREQLAAFNGVLVWVNPIHDGGTRVHLDAVLRDAAAHGVWVSAHPDVILKMGTKEVLYRTRTMSWGCDIAIYRTADELRTELPARLSVGPRVIKRNRGNGGQGVWKVEAIDSTSHDQPMVRVLDATKDASEEMALEAFLDRCRGNFEDGCVIDQPFQSRLNEGVVRCYMVGDRCAGFGHQKVKALVESPAARAKPDHGSIPRTPTPASSVCEPMEGEWIPQLMSLWTSRNGTYPRSGTPISCSALVASKAATAMSWESTSVRFSQFPTKRRPRLRVSLPIGSDSVTLIMLETHLSRLDAA